MVEINIIKIADEKEPFLEVSTESDFQYYIRIQDQLELITVNGKHIKGNMTSFTDKFLKITTYVKHSRSNTSDTKEITIMHSSIAIIHDAELSSVTELDKVKIEVSKTILKNTINIYLQKFILEYINLLEQNKNLEDEEVISDEIVRFDNCISYLVAFDFNMKDWGLWEIPIFYSHCFWNKKEKKAFDLAVWDIGKVVPRYLENGNEQDASSILEAIEKYDYEYS